jgi:hypothetical protein
MALLSEYPRPGCPRCGSDILAAHLRASIEARSEMSAELSATLSQVSNLGQWNSQWEAIQRQADAVVAQRPSDLNQASLTDADADYQRFLIQAYHFKDYLKQMPRLKPVVEAGIDSYPCLQILADLADSMKHGRGPRRNPRSGFDPVLQPAEGVFRGPMRSWHLRVTIAHGPATVDGIELVHDIIGAWNALLAGWGLI